MIDTIERVRRPEHTGDDRCWPCTIANGVLLTVGVVALTVARRRILAAGVAVVGTAAIWLRGYLVPYTPRFAPQLVAALPVDPAVHDGSRERDAGSLADGDTATDGPVDATAPTGEEIVSALLEADVVVPDGEDILLSESFRSEWRREMGRLRGLDLEELAAEADALTSSSIDARVGRDWRGQPSTVRLEGDGGPVVSLGDAVAVADLAAARVLESRIDDEAVRLGAGRPLRSLLERCPRCDGELIVSQASCCGEVTPIGSTPAEKLICPDCDVRLFTYD